MAPQFDRPLRDLLRAAGCTLVRQGKGSHEIWFSPITKRNFLCRPAFQAATPPTPSFDRRACRKRFRSRGLGVFGCCVP
jgi:hypothetical protein